MEKEECNSCHDHDNHSYKKIEKNRLLFAIILTGIVMLIELVGGIITNSLALLSDAGHMFTHFLALTVSFLAIYFAQKPKNDMKTFGYLRLEILAALFNGVFVIAISLYIVYESFVRFMNPEAIASGEMLIIAIVGLVANLITVMILHKASHHDLNVKSAFVHVIGDTLSSVGVIGAAIIIYFTGFYRMDAIVSFGIAAIILYWGFKLIRDSVDILLEATPKHIDIAKLRSQVIKKIKKVKDIHDIHAWELTSKSYCLSAHVILNDCKISQTNKVLKDIENFLAKKYGIHHVTLQIGCSS